MPSSACKKCARSEEHTSELQSHSHLVCRLLLEKKNLTAETEGDAPQRQQSDDHPLVPAARVPDAPAADPAARAGGGARGDGRFFFFFNDPAPPEIYPLSLHDALPI